MSADRSLLHPGSSCARPLRRLEGAPLPARHPPASTRIRVVESERQHVGEIQSPPLLHLAPRGSDRGEGARPRSPVRIETQFLLISSRSLYRRPAVRRYLVGYRPTLSVPRRVGCRMLPPSASLRLNRPGRLLTSAYGPPGCRIEGPASGRSFSGTRLPLSSNAPVPSKCLLTNRSRRLHCGSLPASERWAPRP